MAKSDIRPGEGIWFDTDAEFFRFLTALRKTKSEMDLIRSHIDGWRKHYKISGEGINYKPFSSKGWIDQSAGDIVVVCITGGCSDTYPEAWQLV